MIMDMQIAIYLGIVAFFVIMTCVVCIIFSQRMKIKNLKIRSDEFEILETSYQNLLLEKAKLEEKCAQQSEIFEKYRELSEKYLNLEKDAIRLATNLEQEKKNVQEKVKLLENAEQKLSDTFKSISLDALSQNNRTFIDLAKSVFAQIQEKNKSEFDISTKSMSDLVTPIKNALENFDVKISDLEKSRIGAYEAIRQQVSDMIVSQNALKEETSKLSSSLRSPNVRGRWGEMQLKRVVELSGMMKHCDFEEQVSNESDEGKKIRPDMIIYLPGNRRIVVDSKVPLTAYLQAMETQDEMQRKVLLSQHAKQIRDHVTRVSAKKYWEQFQPGPEFIVLFLPGEVFFSSALEQDPSLIEFAMQEHVVISTPTILLALLHAVAMGWRQENLAENAREIIKMGQELYKRLADMTQHMVNLGKSIGQAVQSYNKTVASMESRVLVTARKFKDLEIHEKEISELSSLDTTIREPLGLLENKK